MKKYKYIFKAQNYSLHSIRFLKKELEETILSSSHILTGDSNVMDIGGDVGIWAGQVYDKYKPNMYISEPNPQSIIELHKKFFSQKVKILEYGIGGKDEKVQLTLFGMGSSVYDSSPQYSESGKVEIELRDVKGVFKELGEEEFDLVKINIEGGEFELLERMIETELVNKFKIIRIQFHTWFTNAYSLRKKIRNKLKKTHNIEWNYPFVWESWIRKDIK